jgi:type II secretory pathway pseudopilin PulG
MSRSAQTKHPRRGTSLIEMLAVIGIIGALMPVLFTLMITMLKAQAGQTDRLMTMVNLRRLSSDFRRDVWSADGIELAARKDIPPAGDRPQEVPPVLRLITSNNSPVGSTREVRYLIEQRPHEVVLIRRDPGGMADEKYIFPAGSARWVVPPAVEGATSTQAMIELDVIAPVIAPLKHQMSIAGMESSQRLVLSATSRQSRLSRPTYRSTDNSPSLPADATAPDNPATTDSPEGGRP